MNERWNLDPLYRGFADPAFEADLNALKAEVARFGEFAAALPKTEPTAGLRRGIELEERITDLVNKLGEFASLRQSADSRDSEAGSQMGRVMAVYSSLAAPDAAFRDWAAKLPDLMELEEGDPFLKDYRFLFSKIQKSSRYLLSGQGEELMASMRL